MCSVSYRDIVTIQDPLGADIIYKRFIYKIEIHDKYHYVLYINIYIYVVLSLIYIIKMCNHRISMNTTSNRYIDIDSAHVIFNIHIYCITFIYIVHMY